MTPRPVAFLFFFGLILWRYAEIQVRGHDATALDWDFFKFWVRTRGADSNDERLTLEICRGHFWYLAWHEKGQ